MLSNKVYEALSYVALIALPAFTTFYTVLAAAWEWDNTEAIVATLVGADALLGTLLKISSHKHNQDTDGMLTVTGHDENGVPKLELVVTRDPLDASKVPSVGRVARLRVRDVS